MQGGAAAARLAHNQEVPGGASPGPATIPLPEPSEETVPALRAAASAAARAFLQAPEAGRAGLLTAGERLERAGGDVFDLLLGRACQRAARAPSAHWPIVRQELQKLVGRAPCA